MVKIRCPNFIPTSIINEAMKCVCNIEIKSEFPIMATGFFMKVSNSSKFIISSEHSIGYAIENNKEIEVEIWNGTRIILSSNGRFTRIFKKELDIAIMEIKDSDSISSAIDFWIMI